MRYLNLLILLICSIGYGQEILNNPYVTFPVAGGAVPVIETFTTNSFDTNSLSVVLDKPTGTQVGDLLLVFAVGDDNNETAKTWDTGSDPTGWTFVRSEGDGNCDCQIGTFWIIATSTETGASNFTFTSFVYIMTSFTRALRACTAGK